MLYKLVPKANGKTDKFPVNPRTLEVTTAHDPANWVDHGTAVAALTMCDDSHGVAFIFTSNDPFFFIDIDNCMVDGKWTQLASELCTQYQGCAIEVSQSGTGLHIMGSYQGATPEHGCKNIPLGLELYTEKRFIALTGTNISGDIRTDCTGVLPFTINQHFPPSVTNELMDWRNTPVDEWNGPEDDDTLINKMVNSGGASSVFGNKATFADLWNNNIPALTIAYPSLNDVDPYDRSSADMALAHHLAFWTGKNHERIMRLMNASGLVRDKWTKHKNYLKSMTISGAVNKQVDVYSSGKTREIDTTPAIEVPDVMGHADAQYTVGNQFLSAEQLIEKFNGFAYIQDRHRIRVSNGSILKPEQFKATFGGYEMTMNADNSKSTTNAWEAFVDNQAVHFPKVSSTCFRPEIASGGIVNEEGRTLVNTYTPIETTRRKGDPTPFLNHMAKLFPDDRDCKIIISYLAALVQNPGVKFQWCPLIQGAEGNGKTLFAKVLEHAIGRRYTHIPNAQDLGNPFNGWMTDKLLIMVEEIFVHNKRELSEKLKTWITNDRVEVQQKGVDQMTADYRANCRAFTNHNDALITSLDSRRYSVFYTPQQTALDMIQCGMNGDYFSKIYDWLRIEGYEIVNDYLHTYTIADEFNPATHCQRAPTTTSTQEAISLSVGAVEQEILEAISQSVPGFAGGWVSSTKLSNLLDELGYARKIPINKRRLLMQSLGYDYHAHLVNGRVNNVIIEEGGKPRLYVKTGHINCNLDNPTDVLRYYRGAQGYGNQLVVDSSVNKA